MRVTLKEIADRANVHVSTVSRVLNSPDDNFATPKVRERIWAIVKETGYIPNTNAQALRRKNAGEADSPDRAGTISCVLGHGGSLDDNPFFAQLSRAVEQQALGLGYSISGGGGEKGFVGAIVLGRPDDPALVKAFQDRYRNLVFICRNNLDKFSVREYDQVICDGYEAATIAMAHLVSYGHRRIGYIGKIKEESRYQAFLDMVKSHGLESSHRLIANCDHNNAEGGYAGAEILLKRTEPFPTAVFCASDVAAIAALKRFREAKLKIPGQISIVSIDNIELSAYVSPMLTTVGMPIIEMASVALQTLINRANRRHRLPLKIYLPNKLAIRESVCNLNMGLYI